MPTEIVISRPSYNRNLEFFLILESMFIPVVVEVKSEPCLRDTQENARDVEQSFSAHLVYNAGTDDVAPHLAQTDDNRGQVGILQHK